ncbi:MAG: hypothetical protein JXB39_14030 [Deltaproteobacteria bacterium]|nr:hypothetical protein [Deltaproteobacteria bacterium]
MANEPREAPVTPSDHQADVLFRVQMKVADIALGYWKQGLIALAVVLALALTVGLVSNHIRDSRRATSAAVARVDAEVPPMDPGSFYGLSPADDLSDPERVAALEKAARGYEAAARDGTGPAVVEAWVRAGETWQRLERTDEAIQAFQEGYERGGKAIYRYAPGNRLAVLLADAGRHEEAEAIYRKMATGLDGYLAEQALMDLMALQAASGRAEAVKRSAAEFRARFTKSPRLPQVAALEAQASAPADPAQAPGTPAPAPSAP